MDEKKIIINEDGHICDDCDCNCPAGPKGCGYKCNYGCECDCAK